MALYCLTLAPGLTWAHDGADGGDFLAAALTGGVAHPTGYPAYQWLLQAAIRVLPGEPAAAGNWLSALCAALAVVLLTDLVFRLLAPAPWRGVVALTAGLAWATSPALWSQAVITEVYTLNALAVVSALWLLWRWAESPIDAQAANSGWGWLAAAALVIGLGLGSHLSLALALPGIAVWLWAGRVRLSRFTLWRWCGLLAVFGLGLAVYVRLPLAAAADPPVNWGDPRTPARLWWLVSGRLYRDLLGGMNAGELLARVSSWVRAALEQLGGGPWGAALAVVGLWQLDRRRHAWWQATGLIALLFTLYGLIYRTDTAFIYLIPAWGMAALWLAVGIEWVLSRLADRRHAWWQATGLIALLFTLYGLIYRTDTALIYLIPAWGMAALWLAMGIEWVLRRLAGRRAAWGVAVGLLVILPALAMWRFYPLNDARYDQRAVTFVAEALAQAEPDAVILTATDRPTFALWYAIYGLRRRPDIVPLNVNLYGYDWYRATMANHHPVLFQGMAGDASLETVVLSAAARGPLYRAEPLSVVLLGLAEEPATGPLVRLRPAK